MLDLDALEALLEKATKCEQDARIDCKDFENAKETMADILRQDIAKSVPSLIAELRELREDEALHVEVIGDLMAETTTLKAEIEKLREATHWRPIAEGLPEERLHVAIYDGETINKAFQRGGGWYCDVFHDPVTHWRPLPDPPEGA